MCLHQNFSQGDTSFRRYSPKSHFHIWFIVLEVKSSSKGQVKKVNTQLNESETKSIHSEDTLNQSIQSK